MKVGELKQLIANVPDNVELVVEGGDHSYDGATALKVEALWDPKYRVFSEYYGPEYRTSEKEKLVPVILVH